MSLGLVGWRKMKKISQPENILPSFTSLKVNIYIFNIFLIPTDDKWVLAWRCCCLMSLQFWIEFLFCFIILLENLTKNVDNVRTNTFTSPHTHKKDWQPHCPSTCGGVLTECVCDCVYYRRKLLLFTTPAQEGAGDLGWLCFMSVVNCVTGTGASIFTLVSISACLCTESNVILYILFRLFSLAVILFF